MTDKVNAIVGLAKCPSSGKLYGVRIEIDGKKWTATWAFPISEEVAKREGYTQNVFPSDLKYSSRYPVCPYCGKREDLAAISQPKRQPPKIAVSSANFDDIGKILKTLGIKFLPYQYCKFDCDLLFLNCGTNDSVNIAGLRDFVDKGGCVYASDLTDSIITAAFPGYFKFRIRHVHMGGFRELEGTDPSQRLDGRTICGTPDNGQAEVWQRDDILYMFPQPRPGIRTGAGTASVARA